MFTGVKLAGEGCVRFEDNTWVYGSEAYGTHARPSRSTLPWLDNAPEFVTFRARNPVVFITSALEKQDSDWLSHVV